MTATIAGFEWDKADRDKCRQHGVTVAAIEAAFLGAIAVFPDPAHSCDEERFKAIGRNQEGRHILIVFTLRTRDGDTLIRGIMAQIPVNRLVRTPRRRPGQKDREGNL